MGGLSVPVEKHHYIRLRHTRSIKDIPPARGTWLPRWLPRWLPTLFSWATVCAAFAYVALLAMLLVEVHLGSRKAAMTGLEESGGGGGGGVDAAVRLFHSLWPSSVTSWGIQTSERSYAEDCRVFTWEKPNKMHNVMETLMDEFVLAHLIGWWAKALIYRNRLLLWMLSIGFELCEVLLKESLPNFQECWWDAIVLDILFGNWIGMELGLWTLWILGIPQYDWSLVQKGGDKNVELDATPLEHLAHSSQLACCTEPLNGQRLTNGTLESKGQRGLGNQLRNVALYLLAPVFICSSTLIAELCGFFIKAVLHLRPVHPFNSLRLILWAAVGYPALEELHTWLHTTMMPLLHEPGWDMLMCTSGDKEVLTDDSGGRFQMPTPLFLIICLDIAITEIVFVLTCFVKPVSVVPQ